jgi:iron(II)-dependent oxidoreductase
MPDARDALATRLEQARRRSLGLLDPLDDDGLLRQHDPIMSPLVWDLGHVGNFEELWLARAVAGTPPLDPALDDVYDAFRHPRPDRPSLPLLGPQAARRYVATVRGLALDALQTAELDDPGRPLLAGGFVYGMVVQHEHQHDETMLSTLQLMREPGYRPLAPPPPPAAPRALGAPAEVLVEPGPFVLGTDGDGATAVYDNERPAHVVELPAFRIDTFPVSNAEYAAFVAAGGYADERLWSADGWRWRQKAGLEHPQFWTAEGGGSWSRLRFGWREELPLDQPVQHVCWYEAEAYARWAGKRLPTEAEWEKAASAFNPGETKGLYPWGGDSPSEDHANLGGRHFGPAPLGAYPGGASPSGCQQMIGDVWEWTSSDFGGYPGFASFPYREYSEVFFGSGYKVLRGGSWATSPLAVRVTFRNWDFPIRRQIFAGFRCARDA